MSHRLYLVNQIVGIMPPMRLFRFKTSLYQFAGLDIHSSVKIVSSARIWVSGSLTIGEKSFIGHAVMIVGGTSSITIGQNVDIAPKVMIVTGTHEIGQSFRRAGKGFSQPITIGNGTWIGAGSTILGGVTVGSGCVVAAGSVVNRNCPNNVLIAGIPARVVRELEP